jgi:hypothetical protein
MGLRIGLGGWAAPSPEKKPVAPALEGGIGAAVEQAAMIAGAG